MKRSYALQLDDSLAGLRFDQSTHDDLISLESLCDTLKNSRNGGETDQLASELLNAFKSSKYVHVGLLKTLSKYCETAASWTKCVKPAQAISTWLTGGLVMPRLVNENGDDLSRDEYDWLCQQIIRFVGADGTHWKQIDTEDACLDANGYFDPQNADDDRRKTLRAIVKRRGQKNFRNSLLAAYEGRCAVTGSNVVPALEAAHISPYTGTNSNHITNGLLLRADIHTLFDLHLIGIEPETLKLQIAESLRQSSASKYAGQSLKLPSTGVRPSSASLREHWDKFQAAQNGKGAEATT